MLGKHSIERLAIVPVKIVRTGIVIHMRLEIAGTIVQLINRLGGGQQRRQGVRGGETAVVFGIEGEQDGKNSAVLCYRYMAISLIRSLIYCDANGTFWPSCAEGIMVSGDL